MLSIAVVKVYWEKVVSVYWGKVVKIYWEKVVKIYWENTVADQSAWFSEVFIGTAHMEATNNENKKKTAWRCVMKNKKNCVASI